MWWRYTIAILAGVIIGFFPNTTKDTLNIFRSIAQLMTNISVYVVVPVVFFGTIVAVLHLLQRKSLLVILAKTLLFVLIFAVAGSILGTVVGFGLISDRIPPTPQETQPVYAPSAIELLLDIFPENFFDIFTQAGRNLLPLTFLAFVIGIAIFKDSESNSLLLNLAQSWWRVLYRMLTVVYEIIAIACVFLAAFTILQIRTIVEIRVFLSLVLVLFLCVVLIVCVGYPLLLTFLIGLPPREWFATMLPAALSSLVTGNVLFSLPTLYSLSKHGVPSTSNNITSILGVLFCRAGTALVASSSFIVILRSYSTLEIQFQQILLIITLTVLFSFIMSYATGQAPMVLLASLSLAYNPNTQELYVILLPIMLILARLAACMDIMTIGFIDHLVGKQFRDSHQSPLYSPRSG